MFMSDFTFHATDEGSSQSESSDNTLYVLDELRSQKSHEKGNASQTSTMQSMYILLLSHSSNFVWYSFWIIC